MQPAVVVLLVGLVGCATAPPARVLAEVDALSVEIAAAPAAVAPVLIGSHIGRATARGAGNGVLAGALAGLSCGPLMVVCAPVAMVVGSVGGAVVGGASEAAATLPDGQPETFNAVLENVFESFDARATLRVAAESAMRAHGKTVAAMRTQATLTLDLSGIDWIIGSSNTVRPRTTLQATARSPRGIAAKTYEHDGPRMSVADWTADSGAPIARELTRLFREIAAEIAADFGVPRSSTETRATFGANNEPCGRFGP